MTQLRKTVSLLSLQQGHQTRSEAWASWQVKSTGQVVENAGTVVAVVAEPEAAVVEQVAAAAGLEVAAAG